MTTNTTVAHPLQTAWIGSEKTGAQNYDEFPTEEEVTAAISARPTSVLAIEMPHCTADSVRARLTFSQALEPATNRWRSVLAAGEFQQVHDVVGLYRIRSTGNIFYGVFCLIDTDQISNSSEEPGSVIRNEDVFIDKVRERIALTESLDAILSPVLLLQSQDSARLQELLVELVAAAQKPAVRDTDQHGNEHEIWLLGPGPDRDKLLAFAGAGELVVADGNHRTLAAQLGKLPRFLAVITTADSVRILPYNRLVSELGGLSLSDIVGALTAIGATVEHLGTVSPYIPQQAREIVLYGREKESSSPSTVQVRLPAASGSVTDRLDHTIVERILFGDILGLDAGDKRITYVGGDHPASWLAPQVNSGNAELAVLIAPVTVDDFIAVNLDRKKMPRKSTWFTPKARAGLLAASPGSA